MADDFSAYSTALDSPVSRLVSVTCSDSTDLDTVARVLYITTSGNVKLTTLGGDTVTINLDKGWHPIRVSRVWSTGTATTTGIFAGW